MKKIIISLVMVVIMLFNILPISALAAQKNYPESPHYYSDYYYGEWNYKYEGNADCLFVTFSDNTYFGPGSRDYSDDSYDHLIIYAVDDDFSEIYYADELAGKTICVPGNEIFFVFSAESRGGYYGFKITDISTQGDLGDNVCVTYKTNENNKRVCLYSLNADGSFPVINDLKNKMFDNKVIIGWKDNNGHKYIYNNNSTLETGYDEDGEYTEIVDDEQYTNVFELRPGDKITLTPIFIPVSIKAEETFSIHNGGPVFNNKYEMTKEHSRQLRKCYQSATWNNQFGVIGVPLGFLLQTVYPLIGNKGSCCGFPISIMMQHYGMIDLLSEEDVSSVNELLPTKNVISTLNFYNAVTPAAIICSHKAPQPGSDIYKAQMKKLFDTVSSGKPVVCFIRCGYIDGISYRNIFSIATGILSKGIKYLSDSFVNTHCILLTGAYIDGAGNRILVGYDENKASYCHGEPQIYKVSGDFEDVVDCKYLESLGDVAWMSDVSCLESFKADGDNNPSAWYSYYRENKDNL